MDFGQLRLGWTQQQAAEFSHGTFVRIGVRGRILIEDALYVGPHHEICNQQSNLYAALPKALVIAGDFEIVVQTQRHLGKECGE